MVSCSSASVFPHVVSAALAMFLSGCGGGGSGPGPSPSTTVPPTTTITQTAGGYPQSGVLVYKSATAAGSNHPKLLVAKGSVVNFKGGALVDAANEPCLTGGGVDGAITSAGGACLHDERQALPEVSPNVRCPTGDAKVVDGCGGLQVDKVILAVGPDFSNSNVSVAKDLLTSAYSASLERAADSGVATIAFPPISAGVFRGSQSVEGVIKLGMTVLYNAKSTVVKEVYVVAFTDDELAVMIKVLEDLSPSALVGDLSPLVAV